MHQDRQPPAPVVSASPTNTRPLLGPVVTATTFVLTGLLAEILLRTFAPAPDPYAKYKQMLRIPSNQFIRSEFPRNYSARTEIEPGLPGMYGVHSFTTNNMGFRGPSLISPKPRNEFRIFIVGASTTECFYLDDSESLDRTVQDALSQRVVGGKFVRVYNAGKSGDASDDHIAMISQRIIHLSPDMIVLFCGINDLSRSIYGYDYLHYVRPSEHRTQSSTRDLVAFLSTEFQIPRRIYSTLKRFAPQSDREILETVTLRSTYKQRIARCRAHFPPSIPPNTTVEAYRNNLKTIVGAVQAHGIDLVFMTQQSTWNSRVDPTAKERHWMLYIAGVTYREDFMDQALEGLNAAMRDVAELHSVKLYDLAHEIPKSSEFFYDDVHFNVKGARRAGVGLASFISEHAPALR